MLLTALSSWKKFWLVAGLRLEEHAAVSGRRVLQKSRPVRTRPRPDRKSFLLVLWSPSCRRHAIQALSLSFFPSCSFSLAFFTHTHTQWKTTSKTYPTSCSVIFIMLVIQAGKLPPCAELQKISQKNEPSQEFLPLSRVVGYVRPRFWSFIWNWPAFHYLWKRSVIVSTALAFSMGLFSKAPPSASRFLSWWWF